MRGKKVNNKDMKYVRLLYPFLGFPMPPKGFAAWFLRAGFVIGRLPRVDRGGEVVDDGVKFVLCEF